MVSLCRCGSGDFSGRFRREQISLSSYCDFLCSIWIFGCSLRRLFSSFVVVVVVVVARMPRLFAAFPYHSLALWSSRRVSYGFVVFTASHSGAVFSFALPPAESGTHGMGYSRRVAHAVVIWGHQGSVALAVLRTELQR